MGFEPQHDPKILHFSRVIGLAEVKASVCKHKICTQIWHHIKPRILSHCLTWQRWRLLFVSIKSAHKSDIILNPEPCQWQSIVLPQRPSGSLMTISLCANINLRQIYRNNAAGHELHYHPLMSARRYVIWWQLFPSSALIVTRSCVHAFSTVFFCIFPCLIFPFSPIFLLLS
jgi:hypothetical protein